MKAAHAPNHSGVRGNASRHHSRQRSRVRAGTARLTNLGVLVFEPACRLEHKTTSSAKYTRRPRKRTDGAVARLRQMLQQKLSR